MPEDPMSEDNARGLGEHAHVLPSLDCDDGDLAPLADVIGDARVVALGEGVHFVAEFGDARRRLLRYLAQRHGYTVLAFEFGFAEAAPLNDWLQGEGVDADLATMAGTTNAGLDSTMARWLRRHNAESGHPVRLIGVDTPMAGGTLAPVVEPLAAYLDVVDPEQAPLARRVLELNDLLAADSVAGAAVRWAELPGAERAELTAALSRLAVRMRALEPRYVERSDRARYEEARRRLDIAIHGDYMFSVIQDLLFGSDALPMDSSVRDRVMADTLLWHLERLGPDAKVVLMAHNNHIQKTPVEFDGPLAYSMGFYLAEALGEDYKSVAMTHTATSVPEIEPDEQEPIGFRVADAPLSAPSEGSLERALTDAGLGGDVTVADLRPLRTSRELTTIRSQSDDMPIAVADAFDAVVNVPTATAAVDLRLG